MTMYPKPLLYKNYIRKNKFKEFSEHFPDITRKITLNNINYAINNCDKWTNFLDIGAGDGRYSIALSSFFNFGTIVEIENHDRHNQIKKDCPNIEILNHLIEDYDTSTKFDFILLADLFEHIPDIERLIEKVSSLQDAGGVIYILTPNPTFCGPATKSELYYKVHEYGHIKHYNTLEVRRIMEKHNYELIFSIFEEKPLRQKVKRTLMAISRRDKKISKYFFYIIFKPFINLISIPLLKLTEVIIYRSEKKANIFNSYSQGLTFKKK